ncbi:MAG TPA: DUF3306 domain-containing protein [Bradyrhizobium sp.]|nr:DUF3306 domain-containing protein [Bradyrhizobium sp.]
MTARENFVSRWARLKRTSGLRRTIEERTDSPIPSTPEVADGAESQPRGDADTTDALTDPAGLPSIETITLNTDIRGFLQSGVRAELSRAALRRAWASDPAIRDFIGIAENQWDFNDPNAIPGFGPLQEQDSAPALLTQVLGRHDNIAEVIAEMPLAAEPTLASATHPESNELGQSAQSTFDVSPPIDIRGSRENSIGEGAAAGNDTAAEGHESGRNRRSHGSALPR